MLRSVTRQRSKVKCQRSSTYPLVQSSPVNHPKGITKGPDGDFFVTRRDSAAVLRYDRATFEFKGEFVASGSGGLGDPIDLVFADGDLLVSDDVTHSVLRYNGQDGSYLGEFSRRRQTVWLLQKTCSSTTARCL